MPEINREAVRLLAIEHGVRGAARTIAQQNGWNDIETNRFEDRVCQWSKRDKWFPDKPNQHSVSNVSKGPADAHLASLQHEERTTRTYLAKYASNAAAAIHRSVHPAKYTKEAKDLASVMATVHRQDETKGNTHFSLNVLNINTLSIDETASLDA